MIGILCSTDMRSGERMSGISLGTQIDDLGEVIVENAVGITQITITGPSVFAGTYSFDTADLDGGPVNLVPVAIEGEVTLGATLSARAGLWAYRAASEGPQLDLQWTRDGADLPGVVTGQYLTGPADDGRQVAVRETLSDAFGSRSITAAPVTIGTAGFEDRFDQANGTVLSGLPAYTSLKVGGFPGDIIARDGAAVGQIGDTQEMLLYTGTPTAPDQYAEIEIGTEGSGQNVHTWAMVRATDFDNYYAARYDSGGLDLYKRSGGSGSTLIGNTSIPAGATIRIEVQGNVLTVLVNGTETMSFTDMAPDALTAGDPAFYVRQFVDTWRRDVDRFACGGL